MRWHKVRLPNDKTENNQVEIKMKTENNQVDLDLLKDPPVLEYRGGKLYVAGLEYKFPKRPLKKEIRNHDLPKRQQKWSRRLDAEEFDWTEGWEDRIKDNPKQFQFIVDELDRIVNGEWIYINGVAEYLNGDSYFFLQHFILHDTGEYPDFRDTILIYYRFCEIVDNTRLCTGDTLLKGRRLGATSMVMSRKLRKSLISRNKSFGITSKTGDDARDAFDILVNAFQNLPVYLKPQIEGNDAPKKILSMKKQASRVTKGQSTTGNREGLNNKIFWRSTSMNTFDSGAFEGILVDEAGKFSSEVPIDKYLQVVTKCVKKGARVTGKISMPTTVNPPHLGGANYRSVYDGSNQLTADYLGQTKTGLYRIMIPAFYGFAGYMDEFGNSVIENPTPEQTKYLESTGECPDPTIGAKQYLELVRKNLEGDEEALMEEIRMNPFNSEEVFETANDRCIFPNKKELIEREKELETELILNGLNPSKDELGRRGWFHPMPNGSMRFVDDDNGLWYVDYLLPEAQANKFEIGRDGKKKPTNEEFGAAGGDPIASGDAPIDGGSDACLMIRSRYSSLDPDNTGKPVAMFLGRMTDPNKLNEQWFNGLIYYGVKVLAERMPTTWLDYAVREGLEHYVYGTKRSNGTEVKGIHGQQGEAVKQEHAETQVLQALHDTSKVPFIRLIRDRKNFNVRKRTDFDACMADGYAGMALKIPFKKKENKKKRKIVFLRRGTIV